MPKRVDSVTCERQVKGWDTLPTYVSVVKFNVPDVWIRFEIKHNKDDEYEPFDNIKKWLLKVVKERQDKWGKLKENMWRYEFVNLILELYTQALVECEGDAFKVEYYEARDQIGKYVDTNKKRIETLNRIKEENKELEKNIKEMKYLAWEKSKELNNIKEEEPKIKEVVEEKPKRTRTRKRVDSTIVESPKKADSTTTGSTNTTKAEQAKAKTNKAVNPLDLLPNSSWKMWLDFSTNKRDLNPHRL